MNTEIGTKYEVTVYINGDFNFKRNMELVEKSNYDYTLKDVEDGTFHIFTKNELQPTYKTYLGDIEKETRVNEVNGFSES